MADVTKKPDPEFAYTLSEMDKAYNSGNPDWFNFLSDDVIVYSVNSGTPFKGKKEYAAHFKKALTASKRKVELLSRDIQTMGKISVVYQTVQINQQDIILNMKQSQVWELTDKGWKVNHIHSALVGSPQAANPAVKRIGAINVLNDKIAAMAAVAGVAQ